MIIGYTLLKFLQFSVNVLFKKKVSELLFYCDMVPIIFKRHHRLLVHLKLLHRSKACYAQRPPVRSGHCTGQPSKGLVGLG